MQEHETLYPAVGQNGIYDKAQQISPHFPTTRDRYPSIRAFLEDPLPPAYRNISDDAHIALQPAQYYQWLRTSPFYLPGAKSSIGGSYGISSAVYPLLKMFRESRRDLLLSTSTGSQEDQTVRDTADPYIAECLSLLLSSEYYRSANSTRPDVRYTLGQDCTREYSDVEARAWNTPLESFALPGQRGSTIPPIIPRPPAGSRAPSAVPALPKLRQRAKDAGVVYPPPIVDEDSDIELLPAPDTLPVKKGKGKAPATNTKVAAKNKSRPKQRPIPDDEDEDEDLQVADEAPVRIKQEPGTKAVRKPKAQIEPEYEDYSSEAEEYVPEPTRKVSTSSFRKRASVEDEDEDDEDVRGRAPSRTGQLRGSSGASSGTSRSDPNKRLRVKAPIPSGEDLNAEDNDLYIAGEAAADYWHGMIKGTDATMPKTSTPLDVGRAQSRQLPAATTSGRGGRGRGRGRARDVAQPEDVAAPERADVPKARATVIIVKAGLDAKSSLNITDYCDGPKCTVHSEEDTLTAAEPSKLSWCNEGSVYGITDIAVPTFHPRAWVAETGRCLRKLPITCPIYNITCKLLAIGTHAAVPSVLSKAIAGAGHLASHFSTPCNIDASLIVATLLTCNRRATRQRAQVGCNLGAMIVVSVSYPCHNVMYQSPIPLQWLLHSELLGG
ncbi:hypothetical protein BDV93DRAFT_515920 [Ceratobasidium sp. AG-I]|nr:hypothetical protein BDV93DRAFT_515920 [Ceratobasidium sp. AG-I]